MRFPMPATHGKPLIYSESTASVLLFNAIFSIKYRTYQPFFLFTL